ncbi:MAG TPA: single-stranded-DNA-specific exonuclease RecJ [Candidatus Saccharimonadales bacterium]|nr:single-stranded-DNA-specific exonuclease RecJ [Candidatus Saccharimonadales bacterium]
MGAAADLFAELLKRRGYDDLDARELFLHPNYEMYKHDPWLLPDMAAAVTRLQKAKAEGERVVIYGDYDIDGLTATTLLRDALTSFGIRVETFIPNRFIEGYGLSSEAMKKLSAEGYQLVVTVDCGSLSHKEIALANELGMEVIVTDHHNVADTMPAAVATINPKRPDHKYPFIDLAGVGVAFKLVQAMQQKMDGLPLGQEKWLLDLVAMGTVCDVVSLVDENRANVFWGLKVLSKTKRVGLRALAEAAGVEIERVTARHLGFVLGPHLNASGRLQTAQISLDLFTATERAKSESVAAVLRQMNIDRRAEQDRIFAAALEQAAQFENDPVLVLSAPDWSHGIIGIVAAKILEHYGKPTFVLQEMEDGLAKGSARSFGDFSAADGIQFAADTIEKGGGHKLAAGVTLKIENIPAFRAALNEFYRSLKLEDQEAHLKPAPDLQLDSFAGIDMELLKLLDQLEPCGNGNPEPIVRVAPVILKEARPVGADGKHLKITAVDQHGQQLKGIGFGFGHAADKAGKQVTLTMKIIGNEWMGRRSVEGQVLAIDSCRSPSVKL